MDSDYQRCWSDGRWQQGGEHRLAVPLAAPVHITTTACIEPRVGCSRISMKTGKSILLEATLLEIGQKADAGIPAWSVVTANEQQE